MARSVLVRSVLFVAALGGCGGMSLPLEGETPSASASGGTGGAMGGLGSSTGAASASIDGVSTTGGATGATWSSLPLEMIQIHAAGTYIQDYLLQATFIGDLDGDGYDELALVDDGVNASGGPGTATGHVYVFYGRPSFPHELNAEDADFIFHGITTELVKLGDLDGDGYDDVLFGLNCEQAVSGCYDDGFYLIYGSSERLAGDYWSTWNPFGERPHRWVGGRGSNVDTGYMSAASAGDVNGDGRPDLLLDVGFYVPNTADAARVTYLVLGRSDREKQFPAPGYADATFTRPDEWTSYGPDHGSSAAGDLDGDGFADVLTISGTSSDPTRFTAVSLFYGGVDRFHGTLNPDDADATFLVQRVRQLDNLGDLDGDGYADLGLIRHALADFSTYGRDDPLTRLGVAYGRAQRFSGVYTDLDFVDFSATSDAQIVGAGAGDINGDGVRDLILASPQAPTEDGSVALFLGTGARWQGDVTASEDFLVQGPPGMGTFEDGPAFSMLGASASLNGDLNGDGFADLAVTTPNFPLGNGASAFVFLGAPL